MSNIEDNKKTVDFYDSLLDCFEELNSFKAKVGVHASAGENNVKKALWNEFGTNHRLVYDSVAIPGVGLKPLSRKTLSSIGYDNQIVSAGSDISIPARPFIRLYLYPELVDKLSKDICDYIDVMLKAKKIRRGAARNIYKRAGATALDLMRSKMEYRGFDKGSNNTAKDQEHNSSLTQYIKGSDTPLFNTGELYDVMESKVSKRGRGL